MSKRRIVKLLAKCVDLELNANSPAKRKYWDTQYKRLRTLAVKLGWMD